MRRLFKVLTGSHKLRVKDTYSSTELHRVFGRENGSAFAEISASRYIVHERAVELRQAVEVELIQRLGRAEGGTALAQGELLLLASGDLILNQQCQKLSVGEPGFDGLSIARLQRIENTGQAQLLEVGGEKIVNPRRE